MMMVKCPQHNHAPFSSRVCAAIGCEASRFCFATRSQYEKDFSSASLEGKKPLNERPAWSVYMRTFCASRECRCFSHHQAIEPSWRTFRYPGNYLGQKWICANSDSELKLNWRNKFIQSGKLQSNPIWTFFISDHENFRRFDRKSVALR